MGTSGGCDFTLDVDAECMACLGDNCCSAAQACGGDTNCSCFTACLDGGSDLLACQGMCGAPSPAALAIQSCFTTTCFGLCG
jgi:hypothetical protein